MSYSPTVYFASTVTPRARARSASRPAMGAARPDFMAWARSMASNRWHGSGSKYSTSLGAE